MVQSKLPIRALDTAILTPVVVSKEDVPSREARNRILGNVFVEGNDRWQGDRNRARGYLRGVVGWLG